MSSTNFINQVTPIQADWLNDVNRKVYIESVSVSDSGVIGDGVTDDTVALQAALNALGSAGGTVTISNKLKCLINSNLTIPANVSLVGPHIIMETPKDNTSTPYGSVGGALILNSSATITLMGGASINGCLIYRKGMTFPAIDGTSFSGTAITIGGDGTFLLRCMILGFAKAYYSNGFSRPRIEDVNIDCQAGIEITNCFDIPRLEGIHCWPFSTVAATGTLTRHHRTGIAYSIHDTVDGPMLSNCFSYGYLGGFYFSNVSTIKVSGCFADNTQLNSGSYGWRFDGNINGFQGTGNSAWSCDNGLFLNHNALQYMRITGFTLNGNTFSAITHFGGDVDIIGNYASGSQTFYNQASANAASSLTQIDYNTVASMSVAFAQGAFASTSLKVGENNHLEGLPTNSLIGGTLPTSITLASATPMQIYHYADTITVTGTTNFGILAGGWAGRKITFIFSGILTVFNGTGATTNMRLSGGANYTSSVGSTLTLKHNGVQWYEIGRSA